MSETSGPGGPQSSVELQIDRVIAAESVQATVTVRCLRGPVCRDAHFHRLSGSVQALDLTLTQIVVYGLRVAELGTGLTALVTLRGEGVQHLKPGTLSSGWQVIQGVNPMP